MQTKIFYLLGVFFISYGLTACQNTKSIQSPDEIVIKKNVQEPFEIHLEACLTCGFDWFLEPVDTFGIRLISKISKPINPDPGIVGGNSMETWVFSGLQEGEYQLIFRYKRPWEEEIMKTRKVTVRVVAQ